MSHNEANSHWRCCSGCPSVQWTDCALSCSLHCSYFTGDIFCVDERLQDEAIQQGRTPETSAEEEVKHSIKCCCENLSHAYCCVLGRYIRAVCGILNWDPVMQGKNQLELTVSTGRPCLVLWASSPRPALSWSLCWQRQEHSSRLIHPCGEHGTASAGGAWFAAPAVLHLYFFCLLPVPLMHWALSTYNMLRPF